MKMQNSDWMEIFHGWWRGDTPIGAALLAIIAAGLRIAYTGGGWRQMVPEDKYIHEAIVLNADTGLIGMPQQTMDGVPLKKIFSPR